MFIERDGVLNLPKIEGQYQIAPRTLPEFFINRAAEQPLRDLRTAGFLVIATTNQPGVSRGHINRREIDYMHAFLQKALPLDDIFTCLHDEGDRCPCRKPQPGLFREASFKWQINLDHSFVISDKWQDAKAAQNAGCTSILIQSPWNGGGHHDFVVDNLESAVAKVIQLQQQVAFSCLDA